MDNNKEKILITGGAGFIGSNLVDFYLKKGAEVIVFDNFSRSGVEYNLGELKKSGDFSFVKGDVRNFDDLKSVFKNHPKITTIFHEAAQVAVTTSVNNPKEDFEINVLGTLNTLEAFRNFSPDAVFIYASTNKVYGGLDDLKIIEKESRYEFEDRDYKNGIPEKRCLDFHSPYGCSKGAADQYVRDYSRIYNLKTVVFRQSCIYGPRQFGIEDQGWVAWFIARILFNKEITLYGTGKQVRDILFIDDLISAYDLTVKNIEIAKGKIYNIGGGANNSISLLELIHYLEELISIKIKYNFADWRHGDQKIFISDNSLASENLNWVPQINWKDGVKKLYFWLKNNQALLEKTYKTHPGFF